MTRNGWRWSRARRWSAAAPDRESIARRQDQGAATINRVIPEALGSLGRADLQVAHLAGKGNVAETSKIYAAAGVKHLVLESSDQMAAFYSAADMVFCRSGGGTVSELAFFGKYAVLVPFPFAAERHQDDNAAFYAASGAAAVVQDSACDQATIARLAAAALADPERHVRLAAVLDRLAIDVEFHRDPPAINASQTSI